MNYLKNKLPKGWAWSSVGEICLIMSGQTPKGINNLSQTNGHIPWFRVGNMNKSGNEKILTSSELMLTLDKISSLGLHVRPANTIVFPKRGGAIATNKKRILGQPSTYDLNLMGISPIEFNVEYFWHWFQSIDLNQLSDGSNVTQINHGDIEPLQIPLPPLNEQKRIVAKIEALQTRSQRVKEELEAIKPLLDQFRQSVLASAFLCDLTKDWRKQNPDVEPAEVLLERIRVERRRRWEEAELEKMKAKGKVPKDDKWKKKYKEPEPIDSDGLPELPDAWCWVRVETIATIASNLVSPENYLDYPHIAPDNIEKGSGRLLKYNTIQEDKVISPKHLFYPGQILYSKIRPYLSKCVLIDFQGLCSADMYPIDSDIDTSYLFRYILSNIFLKLINKASGSRVVLPKANQKQVYSIPVPILPLLEQKEIVRRIESLFKLADKIEQQYQQAEIDLETLNQSILAKAFRGELVPQDPNDEPASVLLERIREERDRAKATAKKSKSKKKSNNNKQDKQLDIPGI